MSQIDKKSKQYPYIENGVKFHKDYCFFINGHKYNRNLACKFHDNAYGINGGGSGLDRKKADQKFYDHMKENKDPLAFFSYIILRLFGWMFFNYKSNPVWKGQIIKKFKYLLSKVLFQKKT